MSLRVITNSLERAIYDAVAGAMDEGLTPREFLDHVENMWGNSLDDRKRRHMSALRRFLEAKP